MHPFQNKTNWNGHFEVKKDLEKGVLSKLLRTSLSAGSKVAQCGEIISA